MILKESVKELLELRLGYLSLTACPACVKPSLASPKPEKQRETVRTNDSAMFHNIEPVYDRHQLYT